MIAYPGTNGYFLSQWCAAVKRFAGTHGNIRPADSRSQGLDTDFTAQWRPQVVLDHLQDLWTAIFSNDYAFIFHFYLLTGLHSRFLCRPNKFQIPV